MQLLLFLVTFAIDTDATRAALYRIDAEARLARMHPEEAEAHAQSAERQARDLAARLEGDRALAPEAGRVQHEADALAEAARGPSQDGTVRRQAMQLEME